MVPEFTETDQAALRQLVHKERRRELLFPLRGRQCSSQQMPFIKDKFANYSLFASAMLSDIYGPQMLDKALHYEATNFASSFIENLGDGAFAILICPLMHSCLRLMIY
ncbi:MAG: hypothetical protein IPL46_23000 [Saprospiraceae bacterium]|nr:hypothetical protein [Saprospiraceae bacterium]